MTTIIGDFRAKVMVCDSMHDWGGRWWKGNKLHCVRGGVLGAAGLATECRKLVEWIAGGREGKLPKDLEAQGLYMTEDGLFALDPSGGLTFIEQGFFCIGTGGDAAMGALMAGASPQRAAEIAAEVDSHSAGPFHVMTLEQALASPTP